MCNLFLLSQYHHTNCNLTVDYKLLKLRQMGQIEHQEIWLSRTSTIKIKFWILFHIRRVSHLSASVHTVDHSSLPSRLEHSVSIRGSALDWMRSCRSDRSFFCTVGEVFIFSSCSDAWGPSGVSFRPFIILIVHATPGFYVQDAWHSLSQFCWWCAGFLANGGSLQGIYL